MSIVVAVLEVMWDWNSMTSEAGYSDRAPPWYRINPDNFTGRRLYGFIGPKGRYFDELKVTNACPQLVTSASGRGVPDPEWLHKNLVRLQPFELLLVCGNVAHSTYRPVDAGKARIIELPHPAARVWSRGALATAQRFIREGKYDVSLEFRSGRLIATRLVPF